MAADEITTMCETINADYPSSIFFTSKLILSTDN